MENYFEDWRLNAALSDIVTAAEDAQKEPAKTISALRDCERALKRIAKRANVPDGYERVEIVQAHGPTVEMTARLLAETWFDTRAGAPLRIVLELFETQGGALVAVSSSAPSGGGGREESRVTVVDPSDDVQAMRFAVMDAFAWHERARSMVRKLGWSLRRDVI